MRISFIANREIACARAADGDSVAAQRKHLRWRGVIDAARRSDANALAVMGPDVYRELVERALPMRLLYEDARRVIVSKQ